LEWEKYDARVSVFATDLLNRKYQFTQFNQSNVGGLQAGMTQEPRMWGVEVRKSFGAGE
jgi:hypothetical protein